MKGDSYDDRIAALERALRGRPGPEPTARFRERVTSGVRRALSEPTAPAGRPWLVRADLVGWAALVLIGLTLSRVASSTTSFFVPPTAAPSIPAVRATAELLRQVSPDLTPDEASRITLASAYRRELLPMPAVDGGGTTSLRAAQRSPFVGDAR
ncbi:MAG TPA: hypothetical protein VGI81_02635 [Tepidisphaeraceae bacterium]|jgi:hypothetical protein